MDIERKRCPDQGDGTFLNPLFPGDYPDPSIVRVGADYYMTHSCFNNGPGLLVWHSRDLVNWRPICNALSGYAGNVMAPDLCWHEGLFYIYYPANKTNWVITAKDPAGPWSEPVDLKVGHIDPGHVADRETGKRYLYLSGNYVVPLSDDGLCVTGEPVQVYEGWPIPEEWSVGGFFPESPKLHWRAGWYYLTTAQGGTAGPATSHMVVTARSRSPLGPWENCPHNPVVRTCSRKETWHCKGHGTLIDTPQGDWWIVYHAYEKDYYTLGRQTLLEPVEWTEDGWFRIPQDVQADRPIPMPAGAPVEHGLTLSDDFSGSAPGPQWRFLGARGVERWRMEGGLVLTCEGSSPDASGPMLLITTDHCYEVTVRLTLSGAQAEGGLLLAYNDKCSFGVSFQDGTVYPLRRSQRLAPESWESDSVWLRVENRHNEVTAYYGDGERWHKLITGMECSGCHHNTFGGFGSVRAGLYACGSGEARFERFTYRALED